MNRNKIRKWKKEGKRRHCFKIHMWPKRRYFMCEWKEEKNVHYNRIEWHLNPVSTSLLPKKKTNPKWTKSYRKIKWRHNQTDSNGKEFFFILHFLLRMNRLLRYIDFVLSLSHALYGWTIGSMLHFVSQILFSHFCRIHRCFSHILESWSIFHLCFCFLSFEYIDSGVCVCVCVCKAKRIFLKIKRKAVAERKERKFSVYFMSYIASMSEICLSFATTKPAIDEFIIFLHLLPLLPGLPYIQFRFSFFRHCTALMMTTENVHIELKSNKTK